MQPEVSNDELVSSEQDHSANLCSLQAGRSTLNLSQLPASSLLVMKAPSELAPQELASSELATSELATSKLSTSQPSANMLSPT